VAHFDVAAFVQQGLAAGELLSWSVGQLVCPAHAGTCRSLRFAARSGRAIMAHPGQRGLTASPGIQCLQVCYWWMVVAVDPHLCPHLALAQETAKSALQPWAADRTRAMQRSFWRTELLSCVQSLHLIIWDCYMLECVQESHLQVP